MEAVDQLIHALLHHSRGYWTAAVCNCSHVELAAAEKELVRRSVHLAELAEYIKYHRLNFDDGRARACADAKAKQILAFLGYLPSNPPTPPDAHLEAAYEERTEEPQ